MYFTFQYMPENMLKVLFYTDRIKGNGKKNLSKPLPVSDQVKK